MPELWQLAARWLNSGGVLPSNDSSLLADARVFDLAMALQVRAQQDEMNRLNITRGTRRRGCACSESVMRETETDEQGGKAGSTTWEGEKKRDIYIATKVGNRKQKEATQSREAHTRST